MFAYQEGKYRRDTGLQAGNEAVRRVWRVGTNLTCPSNSESDMGRGRSASSPRRGASVSTQSAKPLPDTLLHRQLMSGLKSDLGSSSSSLATS